MAVTHNPYLSGAAPDLISQQFPFERQERRPPLQLSTAQAEALAKAGIKVELAGPVEVYAEPLPTGYQAGSPEHLTHMIRERYRMAARAKSTGHHFVYDTDYVYDPVQTAVRYGDKVYVFAGGSAIEPQIIVDELCIFPSDALLAKLNIMVEYAKAPNPGTNSTP